MSLYLCELLLSNIYNLRKGVFKLNFHLLGAVTYNYVSNIWCQKEATKFKSLLALDSHYIHYNYNYDNQSITCVSATHAQQSFSQTVTSAP